LILKEEMMAKAALLILVLALSGCAWMNSNSEKPIGIGGATDDLKRSPCACGQPFYRNGQWLS
jgi:hypothetical protein